MNKGRMLRPLMYVAEMNHFAKISVYSSLMPKEQRLATMILPI